MGTYKYKAFISYSHKDDQWAKWLHRRLETYLIPKKIIGKVTSTGPIPRRLGPVFRDREELAASESLGEKIEQALTLSENLIIICSPQAARSHWVNQEILFFKRHNRGAQLFSVIVEGEPFASNVPGREAEECFPPALRYDLDENGEISNIPAEPLAADIRDNSDGKRLGLLKLVAGMIGVGLDEIVQRDMSRYRRRVTTITACALVTVLAMSVLTAFALDARRAAELAQAEAEAGRNDAEESIEFMLTDLKPKLEKVGRLAALNVLGTRAEGYYKKYSVSKHSDEALGRRARVFHFLGETQTKQGNSKAAEQYFNKSYTATKELLSRDPLNADRVFEHSQSAYWVGSISFSEKGYALAEHYFQEYITLSEKLNNLEPDSLRSLQEKTYAYTNLAIFYTDSGKKALAKPIYEKAIPVYEEIANSNPENSAFIVDLATAYAWAGDAAEPDYEASLSYRNSQVKVLKKALGQHPDNFELKHKYLLAIAGKARIQISMKAFSDANKTSILGLNESIKLSDRDPHNTYWIENKALFYLLDADNYLGQGKPLKAKTSLQKFINLKRELESKEGYSSNFLSRQKKKLDRIKTALSKN